MMDRVELAKALRSAHAEGYGDTYAMSHWDAVPDSVKEDYLREADKALELLAPKDTAKPDPTPAAPDTPEPPAGPTVVVDARTYSEHLARIARLRAALRRAVTIAGDALDGNL